MIFNLRATLENLHCITPTDPSGEDEPYLWAFLIQIDGSTVRQRVGDQGHLSANITIHSGSGRPGNLGVDSFKSGGNIFIHPDIGGFNTSLTPIKLTLSQGPLSVRVFLPGTAAIFCMALDEDGTKRDAMEGAFNDVKNEVRDRFNDFLNGLDLQSIATAAVASPTPLAKAKALFDQQLNTFIEGLLPDVINVAIQSAELSVMSDWSLWDPFSWLASADADEPVGAQVFILTEQSLIDSNLAMPLHSDLRQSTSALGGAWYIVDGHSEADIHFTSSDLRVDETNVKSAPISPPQPVVFRENHLCISAGTTVNVQMVGSVQTYVISVQYPFARYRYSIDGQVLNGNSGRLVLTKSVRSQVFDEKAPGFIKNIYDTKQVTLSFSKSVSPTDPQIELLSITNSVDDENYNVDLTVDAVLNDGRVIHVGDQFITFEGKTLHLPDDFMNQYRKCMQKFSLDRFAKTKLPSWLETHANGPAERIRQLERVSEQLDAVARLGIFQQASVDKAKLVFAEKLNVPQKTAIGEN